MIMKKYISRTLLFGFLAGILTITACVKGDFDEPPIYIPHVDFESNTSIETLKTMLNGTLTTITDDIIIKGKVVANDESGNLYKKIVIQDETAGIEVLLNAVNLYNEYKPGQEVYIKCKGMYLGSYKGLIQLGYDYNGGIGQLPEVMINEHLYRDSLPGSVPEPVQITPGDNVNNAKYLSMLVSVDNANFPEGGTTVWAPGDASTSHSLFVSGKELIVRTSNYANFALDTIPAGYGKVIGILSIYNTDYQLTLRDAADLQGFSGETPISADFVFPATGLSPVTSIDEKFDNIVASTDVAINGWTNKAAAGSRNWQGKTFQAEKYAQATSYNTTDAENKAWLITPPVVYSSSLKLSFSSEKAYYKHDGLSVWILTNYTGDPNTATWTKINATVAGSANADYEWVPSGDINLSDYVPANYTGNVYIGFEYTGNSTNTTTYCIDNILVGTGGGSGGGTLLDEGFTTALGSFSAVSVTGSQAWGWADYDEGSAKMSGYASGSNHANEDWLISPQISLAGKTGVKMSFREAINYITSINDLKVLVSTNYSGSGDPNAATWNEVTGFTRAAGNNWTFVDAGQASLSAYEGQNIHIGFKYVSSASAGATWEIGQVVVTSSK